MGNFVSSRSGSEEEVEMADGINNHLALLDLSFLSEEERGKIERVLKADQEVRTKDRVRLGTLRQEIEQERYHQKLFLDKRQCSCCEQPLGLIFNSGANCPNCVNLVCKQCRKTFSKPPPKFICTVCAKQRLLDLQTREYILPSGPTSTPSPATYLYGSELIRQSLQVSEESTKEEEPLKLSSVPVKRKRSKTPELPAKFSKESESIPRINTTSTSASSMVVQPQSSPGVEHKASLAQKVSSDKLTDSDEETEEKDKVFTSTKRHMKRSDSSGSIGSMTSMYSASCGKGDYEICGKVLLGVWHKEGQLFVRVTKAMGIAAAKKNGVSDPYIKTYLLPDKTKQSKRKTSIQKKTLNPCYNEILKYKLPQAELNARTLWLSVWDWDRFGRNQFLGEVRLPLSTVDLTNSTDEWYTLQDKEDSADEILYHGKLCIGLKFAPHHESREHKHKTLGTLHVAIKQARELPVMDAHGLTDATVKCFLLPNRSTTGKRKTRVVKNNLNPVWEEEFTYKNVAMEELSKERVLEVTVWDYDRRGSNDFIGGLHLGPTPGSATKHREWIDSIGEEISHWEAMLAHPGEWVEQWHTLRPSMDPMANKRAPPTKELSPVQELSPTQENELSHPAEQLPTLEAYSFTPPITPSPTPAEDASPQSGTKPVASASPNLSEKKGDSPSQSPRHETNAENTLSEAPAGLEKGKSHTVLDPEPSSSHPPSTSTLAPSPAEPPPSQLTSHLGLKHYSSLGSFGSMNSVYSEAGEGKGDYDITGEVLFGVQYKGGQLLVHVNKARGLAAADSNGLSDPYVKTYLLPDKSKHSKKKTSIKRKTLDPVYNETLKYKLPQAELSSRTLWLSVWDWDRFGRNQFLGEVRLPISSLNLTDTKDQWYTLQEKDDTHREADMFYRGELRLGLLYTPGEKESKKGTLTILVRQAKELPKMDPNGLANAVVKCYLLPDKSSSGKRKTGVIKNNLNPVWEEQFTYKVTLEELSRERVLEVTVWDFHKQGNDFIGGLRLGPAPGRASKHKEWMDSIGEEISHWEAMLAHPGEWVEQWHTLRTTMDPRKVDISSVPLPSLSEPPADTDEVMEPPSSWLPPQQPSASSYPSEDEFRKVKRPTSQPISPQTQGDSKTLFGSEVTKHEAPTQTSKVDENISESLFGVKETVRTHPTPVLQQPSPPRTPSPVQSGRSTPEKGIMSSTPAIQVDRETQPGRPESIAIPRSSSQDSLEGQEEAHTSQMKAPAGLEKGESHIVLDPEPSSSHPPSTSTLAPSPAEPPPSQLTSHFGLKHYGSLGSFGSMNSVYSEAGEGKGDYDITGEVLFGVQYKGGQLLVHVNKARGLAAADSNGLSDPYVKTYLLPDKSKHSKKKTSIKRKTLDPVYNETLKYKLPQAELSSRTLWLSVWDWDRFGRNQFLGEVRLPLSSLNLTDTKDQWYTLQEKDDTHRGADMFYRGELRLGLLYTPSEKESKKGTLTILVRQAKELPNMDPNGLANAVVKCYLLPDKSSSGKRKTGVIKNNLNPVWEEQFTYKVTLEELSRERVLEVTVWDFHKQGNDFIGGLRLGPAPGRASKHKEWMDSIGEEISHWEAMLAHPGEWVEQWHTLRTTMDPRKVDISSVPLPSLSEPPADTDEVMEPPSSWLPRQQPSPSSYPSEDEFRKVKRPTSQPTSPQTQGDSKTLPSLSEPPADTNEVTEPPSSWLPRQQPSPSSYPSEGEFRKVKRPTSQPISPQTQGDSKTLFGSKVTTPSKHEAPTQTSKMDENISESLFGVKETVRTHPTPVLQQPSPPRTPSPENPVHSGRSTPEKGIMSSTPAIQVDHETQPGQRPESIAISQSSSQDSLEGQEEAHTSQMKGATPLGSSNLLRLQHAHNETSFGSMASIYSEAGGKGDYDITGEVLFGVQYKGGQLLVHVNKARGLAAADSNGLSDPYVKTYLLPDKSKHSKKKTSIKRKTLDPVYNETLKYKLPQAELSSRTLWLSVWDWDRFGRNQFLGEVRLPLSYLNLADTTDEWYTLQDKDGGDIGGSDTYRGQLKVALMLTLGDTKKGKTKATLKITMKQARDLLNTDTKGLTDAFVKCYLLPDKSSSGKRKTGVVKNNLNPVWEEQFTYDKVTLEELSKERVLEVTVWDFHKQGNELIGGLRLGPAPGRAAKHKEWMDSIGEEISHWEAMLAHPGEWVEQWHTLRTTMDPRSVGSY